MPVPDQRGVGKQIKRILPTPLFRTLTVVFNAVMRVVPFRIKYAIGGWLRRGHAPYSYLAPTDTVVQIGSARDILLSGRSRALHLARCVPQGKVVVIEADADNCAALRKIIQKHRIGNVIVEECGAWSEKATLAFLSSPIHPAANLLVDVKDLTDELIRSRKYNQVRIEVDSVDHVLRRLGLPEPAMVSITTNGAELQILEGMRETMSRGCSYITLASTGEGFHEHMQELGYEYVARDDRGYCFRKIPAARRAAAA